jgi:hypothetical protein
VPCVDCPIKVYLKKRMAGVDAPQSDSQLTTKGDISQYNE